MNVDERLERVRERYRTDDTRPIVWSYGGGTQTAAIAVLILQGRLPRPERIVMADTAREATATWDYLRDVVSPALEAQGMVVEVIPHDVAKHDLWADWGEGDDDYLLLPAYTSTGGRMRTMCSNDWKRDVVFRYLRSEGYGPRNPVQQWIGFSTDEMQRLRDSRRKWISSKYPLCFDVPLSREECKQLVADFGWPEPPKSSCWMCPHRTNANWRELRDNYPDDFEAACQLDEEIRLSDPDAFVHFSGKPLREADLGGGDDETSDSCDSGYCFV